MVWKNFEFLKNDFPAYQRNFLLNQKILTSEG